MSKVIDDFKKLVKGEASPGVPLSRYQSRNDHLFAQMGDLFNDAVLNRLELLMKANLDDLKKMSRREIIEKGYADPVRVFVKNEPHKKSKLESGKVRLIMSVSIIDKMIEMLLARHMCKKEIANWKKIPSKPGIGFDSDDNLNMFWAVKHQTDECDMAGSDIKGWDWSVDEWQILDDVEMNIKLTDDYSSRDSNGNSLWAHLMRAKAILECRSVFQFSDGTLVALNFLGVMLSGKFKTSFSNSKMRARVADLIGAHVSFTAGDDCLEKLVKDAIAKYLEYGIRVKEYTPLVCNSEGFGGDLEFEFCSHKYDIHGAYPVNIEKMVMNLLHQTPSNFKEFKQLMIGFQDEIKGHPRANQILQDIEDVGFYVVEGPHYIVPNDA